MSDTEQKKATVMVTYDTLDVEVELRPGDTASSVIERSGVLQGADVDWGGSQVLRNSTKLTATEITEVPVEESDLIYLAEYHTNG